MGDGTVYSRIGINEDRAAHQTSPALGSTSRNSLFSHTEEPRFLQQLSTKASSTPQPTISHKFSTKLPQLANPHVLGDARCGRVPLHSWRVYWMSNLDLTDRFMQDAEYSHRRISLPSTL